MEIFLIEDDDAISMGLAYSLEKEGYSVTHVRTLKETREQWTKGRWSLAIIDINLPDGNGYDACRLIKQSDESVPVIFLTAIDAEVNVVMGLEMGADDYVTKPFRINELMARIRTVLRRSGTKSTHSSERFENLRIYPAEARVTRINEADGSEEMIELTALEYRLLLAFLNNRGIVLTRSRLLEELWDVSGEFVNDNTLTVYIKRLRDKIEQDPSNPKIIKTVRGIGYKA